MTKKKLLIAPAVALILLPFATITISGCSNAGSNANAVGQTASSASVANAEKPVIVTSKVTLAYNEVQSKGEKLIAGKKFAEIEKQAAQYRKSQKKYLDGFWELAAFYHGMSQVAEDATEAEWEARRKTLEGWVSKAPESITAHVALARCYYDGAYRARGTGWASSVTEDQAKIMAERLDQGVKALSDSATMRAQCPVWFAAAQRIAFLEGRSKAEFDEITQQGLRLFPTYDDYHFLRAKFVMERWYGEKGDWPKYAAEVADKTGGAAGDVLYARIIWFMQNYVTSETPDELGGFDWPRAKRGFDLLLKKTRLFRCGGGLRSRRVAFRRPEDIPGSVPEDYSKLYGSRSMDRRG